MNSLYQEMVKNQLSQNNQFSQIFKMVKNSSNPQQLITNMLQSNPKYKQTLDMIQSSGKSPKDLFYAMAKQKGVNPDDILNMLK